MNARSKDLAVLPQMSVTERAAQALSREETEAEILALVEKSKPIIAVTDNASREICHESMMSIKKLRVLIAKRGKEGREEATKYSQAVIAIEKQLIGLLSPEETRLEKLRDEFDAAKAAEKQRLIDEEVARVNALKERIEELRGCPILTPASGSKLIAEHVHDLNQIVVDESFAEFHEQALSVKDAALKRLAALLDAAIAHEEEQKKLEAERAELVRLREEQAERDRATAARLAEEARAQKEAQAKADAEAAVARAEAERIAKAERDAAAALVKAERERLVAEAREHAQRIAAEKAENERKTEEQRAALAAEAGRLAAERAAFEAAQEAARKAAEPKPEPIIADDAPTVKVETLRVDPESLKLAEHFLTGIDAAEDWHKQSLAQAIQMAVEDWFVDFHKDADGAEEETDVPW